MEYVASVAHGPPVLASLAKRSPPRFRLRTRQRGTSGQPRAALARELREAVPVRDDVGHEGGGAGGEFGGGHGATMPG